MEFEGTDLAVSLTHIFPRQQTQFSSLSFEAELASQVWTGCPCHVKAGVSHEPCPDENP